jgi:hypothetical protein
MHPQKQNVLSYCLPVCVVFPQNDVGVHYNRLSCCLSKFVPNKFVLETPSN